MIGWNPIFLIVASMYLWFYRWALSTLVRFMFIALFCCHLIANAKILLTVSPLLTSLSKIFNKKKLK